MVAALGGLELGRLPVPAAKDEISLKGKSNREVDGGSHSAFGRKRSPETASPDCTEEKDL